MPYITCYAEQNWPKIHGQTDSEEQRWPTILEETESRHFFFGTVGNAVQRQYACHLIDQVSESTLKRHPTAPLFSCTVLKPLDV